MNTMNIEVRLIFGAMRRDTVTALLQQLHWLRLRERTSFKVASLGFQFVHGVDPSYPSADLRHVANRHPRSVSPDVLVDHETVHRTRLSTVSDGALPIVAAGIGSSMLASLIFHGMS